VIGSRVACALALLAGFVAVEPSLGVLLTYAQRQIERPLAAELRTAPTEVKTRAKVNRKGKLPRSASLANAGVSVANLSQTPETALSSAPQNTDISTPAGGPQLLHRGSAAPPKASRQQTVIPIDDPSGQPAKAGDHDHQEALQQTATAAAVLKRLSTFDHR
jgi:hypothetical protein